MKQHLHIRWTPKTDKTFVLNLDNEFSPFKDDENLFFLDLKRLTFYGGEPHLQIDVDAIGEENVSGDLIITQRYNTIQDFMDIILAVDAARRIGFKSIQLILPYFPAARQDRVCNKGEPLTVKVFADMINSCGFDRVFILTPHSEVTPALLDNVVVLDELEFVEAAMPIACPRHSDSTINVVCPDAGAGKRVGKIAQYLATKYPQNTINLIRCEKVRDVRDGSLKEFHVQADDLGGYPTIIFDDIVSLGGTFIGLGEVLKQKNCGKLMLFTSHADCIEGLEKMKNYFDHVFVTNSRKNWSNYGTMLDKITTFEIKL
jgi:ribose-phosphate pyrophosphokinase